MVQLKGLEKDSRLAPVLAHHWSSLYEDDKEVEQFYKDFDGPQENIHYASTLKFEGNQLHKLSDFNNALANYNKAYCYS